MANTKDEVVLTDSVMVKFEKIREAIRTRVKGGMQTHVAQDLARDLTRLVDDAETELRSRKG